jgi:hypothetical protein
MRNHTQQTNESHTTRQPAPTAPVRGGMARFIATLGILVALLALAPTRGAGQLSQSSRSWTRLHVRGSFAAATQPSTPLFLPAKSYDSGGISGKSVVVADVNGDGKPDLVVANQCVESSANDCIHGLVDGSADVLLGNGDGTFRPAVSYSSNGLAALSVAVGDVNGDGKPDLIVANRYACANTCPDGSVVVRLGNGDGTFQSAVAYDSGGGGAWSVVIADVNRDGKSDLVVVNECGGSSGCTNSTVAILLGKGDGTFTPAVAYDSGGQVAMSVAVADVNGDGNPDLMVADCSSSDCANGTVGVLLGKGDGTFQAAVSYDSGGPHAISVAVADVNGDSKPDLVVANYYPTSSVGVLLGNGDGTFQAAVTYDSGGQQPISVASADVNGDGKPDLLVANVLYSVGVLLGNGDGTFQAAVDYSSGGEFPNSVAVADVNGDGKPDLVVANAGGTSSSAGEGIVGVLLNDTGSVRNPTNTTLTSSLNPSVVGQAVTFKATVSSSAGAPPNGELITFKNGSAVLGTAALSAGNASLTISSLPAGIFTITASYPGDSTFGASTSPGLRQVVNSTTKSATATILASSLNPSIYGQKVTWTATVTSTGSSEPTGKVTFKWQGNTIGSATLNASGVATLTKSNLNADAYPLTVVYSGDAANLGSTSTVLNQVVTQTTSSATLTSSPNPSAQGQAVTFTATITSPTVTAQGPVTFTAGKTVLGTAQLSSGHAKLTITSLAVGSTKVTATYYGDSNIAKSSASVTHTVQ